MLLGCIMPFYGFSLIKLNKAVGQSDDVSTYADYDVTIHNVLGKVTHITMKLHQIDTEWCKLRMTGDRFAMLQSGKVVVISEEEYNSRVLIMTP